MLLKSKINFDSYNEQKLFIKDTKNESYHFPKLIA